jgi:hypothetical protein
MSTTQQAIAMLHYREETENYRLELCMWAYEWNGYILVEGIMVLVDPDGPPPVPPNTPVPSPPSTPIPNGIN